MSTSKYFEKYLKKTKTNHNKYLSWKKSSDSLSFTYKIFRNGEIKKLY